MEKKKALIIEDIPAQAQLAECSLGMSSKFEFEVDIASDGALGLGFLMKEDYDVAIIDRQLPKLEGLEIVRTMRAVGKNTPVIIMTCLNSVESERECWNLQVDGFMPKPIKPERFVMSVEAVVERYVRAMGKKELRVRDVTIDMLKRKVTRNGKAVKLTTKEYNVFELLAYNQGEEITYEDIEKHAYDYKVDNRHTIHVCVDQIKSKLKAAGGVFEISNVPRVGYVIR